MLHGTSNQVKYGLNTIHKHTNPMIAKGIKQIANRILSIVFIRRQRYIILTTYARISLMRVSLEVVFR